MFASRLYSRLSFPQSLIFFIFYLRVKLNAAPTIAITIRHNSSFINWKRIPRFVQTSCTNYSNDFDDFWHKRNFGISLGHYSTRSNFYVCQTDFDGERLLRKKSQDGSECRSRTGELLCNCAYVAFREAR